MFWILIRDSCGWSDPDSELSSRIRPFNHNKVSSLCHFIFEIGQSYKATYNHPIALLLPDAPMSSPYKTVKKQDKLGPLHHATLFYLIIFWRLSVCSLVTSDFINFSAHPCATLLADCSLYREAIISSLYHLFPLSFLIFILLFSVLLSLSPSPLSITLFYLKSSDGYLSAFYLLQILSFSLLTLALPF